MATFVASQKGGTKLEFEGHLYQKKEARGDNIYWRCDQYKTLNCTGTAKTIGLREGTEEIRDQPGNVFLYWGCAQSFWSDECIVRANVMQMGVGSANVSCECFRGETGVDCAQVQKNTSIPDVVCKCGFGEIDVEFGNRNLRPVGPKKVSTTSTSTTATTNTTSSIHPDLPPDVVIIESTLQCFAWQICNLNAKWKAKVSRRFSLGKKCDEVIENWEHLKEKRSNTEYVNNVNNKNGQLFLAEFIGAAIKSAI
ncbi:hypothetical protein niasHT_021903 [Heterodera trifolii]|uniref:FLYWCH-type domain-containing protein n=1 Tax=Heterodera trifolii TaxID=157864 RepID=A0ABD2K8Y1_9BILA